MRTIVFGEKPKSNGNLVALLNEEAERLAAALSGHVTNKWDGILAVIEVTRGEVRYQIEIGEKSTYAVRADGSLEQTQSIFASASRRTGLALRLSAVLANIGYRAAQVQSESNRGWSEKNVTFKEANGGRPWCGQRQPDLGMLMPGVGGYGKFPF